MSCGQTVLVVDDDAFIRRPLEFILRQEGFDPVTAADADECMARIASHRPDLIIMDVMMPGTDGFELCRRVRSDRRYADIPIILLSARSGEHDRSRGLGSGAADFMSKPYSPSELLSRVRAILSETIGRGQAI